ncbi:mitochondrial outer membrane protein SLC25A46 [Octopus bimaculoides]|uniref:Solute carrier family 25 member 46 n=1 Tax=Octopus bimaculoides TaxID=37653 RepID=A0A0L8FFY7_OCTBM|nr:mitochondrial outer membrane protein SLC25A46 [Octopus bimaculoides]|eukprot:XP_014790187.1 PREDICTED: solute carrier family 25 member 46-like [Octopus bimaculoides]
MGTQVMGDHHSTMEEKRNVFQNRQPIPEPSPVNYYAAAQPPSPRQTDIVRFTGMAVGISSLFAEKLLSHPCIVLRRQCQVHYNAKSYHLTPFTLFQIIVNLQQKQGSSALWKGVGSMFVVKGLLLGTETIIDETTWLPKEISAHSSLKKYVEHLLLKGISFAVNTPFYAAVLIETVQSDIGGDKPGLFDCVKEGVTRVVGIGMPQTTRLLPIYKLMLPTATYWLLDYITTSIAQYTVMSAVRSEQQDQEMDGVSVYQTCFPELLAQYTGGLLSNALLFPLETVLHRLYLQGTRTIIDNTDNGLGVIPINTKYEGVIDCFKSIFFEEGVFGFYKGVGALILQYALHALILKGAFFLFNTFTKDMTPQRKVPASQTPAEDFNPFQPRYN